MEYSRSSQAVSCSSVCEHLKITYNIYTCYKPTVVTSMMHHLVHKQITSHYSDDYLKISLHLHIYGLYHHSDYVYYIVHIKCIFMFFIHKYIG